MKSEPLQTVSSDHSRIKLEINNFQIIIKISRQNAIKEHKGQNGSLTNKPEFFIEIKLNPIYQTASDIAKTALRRTFVALKVRILGSH